MIESVLAKKANRKTTFRDRIMPLRVKSLDVFRLLGVWALTSHPLAAKIIEMISSIPQSDTSHLLAVTDESDEMI